MLHSIAKTRGGLVSLLVSVLFFGSTAAGAAEVIAVSAGPDGVAAGPISFAPDKPFKAGAYELIAGNDSTSAQADAAGRLYWWTHGIPANQSVSYRIKPDKAAPRVEVIPSAEQIQVLFDNQLFTTMHFKKSEPRVYLYPLVGPTGVSVTRDFIMRDTPVEKDNKRQDHPHHRSFWTAWGDVRVGDFETKGHDFWAEGRNKPIPRQVLTRVLDTQSGPVFGRITAEIEWRDPEDKRLFTEIRTYTFFAGDRDQRVLDQQNTFKFNDMDVMFADTKEGGICSIRLAVTMDEVGTKTPKDLRGQMLNSRGDVGEKACWGKPAEWCDYVGPLENETVGVAIFDHPKNLRHPTPWHIRGYGLYTANPFGLRDFTGDKSRNGSQTWKKGETAEFNYRVIIHKGDTVAAGIAEKYKLYERAPRIILE